MPNYIKERVRNYGSNNHVYREHMHLKQSEYKIIRKVDGLTTVFAKVGGLIHMLTFAFHFTLVKYSLTCFKINAINDFFKIITEDEALLDDRNHVKISLLDKLRLFTKCFPN
jgi:hypothetical protein